MNPELNVYFISGDSNISSTLDKEVINICTKQGKSLKSKNLIKGAINNLYNLKSKKILKLLLKNFNKSETIIHVHGCTKCLSCSILNYLYKNNYNTVITLHDYFIVCPNGGYVLKKHYLCNV